MEWVIVILYCLSMGYIFLFSMGQLHLTAHYLRSRKTTNKASQPMNEWPKVTVQLPLYNEKYVVERLVNAVTQLDYPTEKLQIQILDDSDDETTTLIEKLISEKGSYVELIRREDRKGFKAGALEYGLERASGDYIAIFDSDFVPQPDFLKKTLPVFEEGVGVVQTRWGHLNKDYSLLTKLQAFGLDAHFTIEQGGREHAGSFINFNGTGGVWRKECIQDAGGWSSDTLTEDLDLSYRAQLKGWKFKYLEDCVAPAELPVLMSAVKSQQYRWNKGAAETARKNLKRVLTSRIGFANKVHAFFHLLNSSVFVFLLFASLLSIPMLYIKQGNPQFTMLFNLGSLFLLGFMSITLFYWIASKTVMKGKTGAYFMKTYPLFLIVSMGLSLHNGIAVLEGLFGRKTPFVRTPKFNVFKKGDSWVGNKYIRFKLSTTTVIEGILSAYFLFGIYAGINLGDWGLMIFHVMLSIGFALVFYYSVKQSRYA